MNFLRNLMIGRYGPDHLNTALILISLLIGLIARVTGVTALVFLSYLFLLAAIFRMMSRNIQKRRAENDRFLCVWTPLKQRVKRLLARFKAGKTHRFFKCPSCRNTLRVPRGKGKLQITCPKCGERFVKKT